MSCVVRMCVRACLFGVRFCKSTHTGVSRAIIAVSRLVLVSLVLLLHSLALNLDLSCPSRKWLLPSVTLVMNVSCDTRKSHVPRMSRSGRIRG